MWTQRLEPPHDLVFVRQSIFLVVQLACCAANARGKDRPFPCAAGTRRAFLYDHSCRDHSSHNSKIVRRGRYFGVPGTTARIYNLSACSQALRFGFPSAIEGILIQCSTIMKRRCFRVTKIFRSLYARIPATLWFVDISLQTRYAVFRKTLDADHSGNIYFPN